MQRVDTIRKYCSGAHDLLTVGFNGLLNHSDQARKLVTQEISDSFPPYFLLMLNVSMI